MLGRPISSGSSLLRLPVHARGVVLRLAPFQCQSANNRISRPLILSLQRSYASTPGRPRSTVGEPSKTVKRAVKRAARTTDGGETKTKQKTGRAKKATKAKAKAKPKARKPKQLTPEQQARKDVRLARKKVRDLKEAALSPPTDGGHISAWAVFSKEKIAERRSGAQGGEAFGGIPHLMKAIAEEWKSVSPAEQEHYNHLSVQQRQAAMAEYKRWVESHTPEQIQAANRARLHLKRLNPEKKKQKRYQPIQDERAVKRPLSAFVQFMMNRHSSGDFKNIPVAQSSKLISQEWKALNEGEKKKYNDIAAEDLRRYSTEHAHVFGHAPPHATASATA